MILIAAAVGALGGWLGLVVATEASVHHDVRLAAGATVVLVLTVLFALAGVWRGAALLTRRRGAS